MSTHRFHIMSYWIFFVIQPLTTITCHNLPRDVIDGLHPELAVLRTLKGCIEKQVFSFSAIDEFVRGYNMCTKILKDKQKGELDGIDYMYATESYDVSLSCADCLPYEANITWTKLYPENFNDTLVEWANSQEFGRNLQLPQVHHDNTSYYICNWTYTSSTGETIGAIGKITSLEVLHLRDFKVVTKRNYVTPEGREIDDHGENIYIYTEFGPWSYCSRCDKAGKRHRIGLCFVTIWDWKRIDPSLKNPWTDSILLFKDKRMSCKMFVNLFPEILSDPQAESTNSTLDLLSLLAPTIMIAYCKIPCNMTDINHRQEFENLPQGIRDFYLFSTRDSDEQSNGKIVTSFLVQLSQTKPFDVIVMILLVFIILFVLYNVIRNRKRIKKEQKEKEKSNNIYGSTTATTTTTNPIFESTNSDKRLKSTSKKNGEIKKVVGRTMHSKNGGYTRL